MKVGRNDPCPCGSGKKYKKCCMEKESPVEQELKIPPIPVKEYQVEEPDEEEPEWEDIEIENLPFSEFRDEETGELPYEEEIVKELLEQQLSLFEEKPDHKPQAKLKQPQKVEDKDIKAIDQRWDEFERAGYEAKIEIYLRTVDEKELMDNDMAFEMLSSIYDKAIAKNQRDRFEELLDKLQQKLPDIYEASIAYYLKWRITNAVVAGRRETVQTSIPQLTTLAGKDIDIFNQVEDMLAYHGYQSMLYQTLRAAWSSVKSSPDIVPWGIDEFANRTANYTVFEYIDSCSQINNTDIAKLIKSISPYIESIDYPKFTQFVNYVSGTTIGQWGPDDFDLRKRGKKSKQRKGDKKPGPQNGRQNLYHLTLEFLSYLRNKENVSFTKGELAREQLFEYFIKRHKRKLIPQPSPLEQMMNPQANKPKKQPPPKHVLCPDGATLDVFFAGLLDFINPQYYKVAATVELIPSWLRFLELKNLVDADIIEEAKDDIRARIVSELKKIWKNHHSDPGLYQGLVQSWES